MGQIASAQQHAVQDVRLAPGLGLPGHVRGGVGPLGAFARSGGGGAGLCGVLPALSEQGASDENGGLGPQRQRHGGESVLEWDGPYAEGEPDAEFGRLVVQFKQKKGSGYARFYERGLVRGKRRLPYSEVKDMLVLEENAPKMATALRRMQDQRSTGLNIYPKKGMQMVISKFDYEIDIKLLRDVQNGLGYRN